MKKVLTEKMKKIETINLNNHQLPIVVSIPHSGIYLSKSMSDNLLDNIMLPNMDWYLKELYSFLEELNITVIINKVSRYVIDPNREVNKEVINDGSYSSNCIYTKTTFGKEMYKEKPDFKEIESRINEFYIPYHETLKKAIADKLKYFDKVYLIDLHSFGKNLSTDIVLGNDNGNTTSDSFFKTISNLLIDEGFKVKSNTPYKGGYITKHYGNKITCEALQIELWYQTYIDKKDFGEEEMPKINEELFKATQQKLKNVFVKLSKL